MSFTIDGTNGLTFNNSTTQASAGVVLQVVNATYSTEISTTSTSYATTNLTASITPKFSTSKILVLTSAPIGKNGTSGINLQLWRNSGSISQLTTNMGYDSTSNNFNGYCYVVGYLDSPATTSSTTYSTQFCSSTNNAVVYVQNYYTAYATSTITLMEIAA